MAQRVLVTAGAAGIGKEIARAFAANGATVCVCDIDVKALDTAAKDIPGLCCRAAWMVGIASAWLVATVGLTGELAVEPVATSGSAGALATA